MVLGLEANYMHGNFGGGDSGTMSRFFDAGGYTNYVTYGATSSFAIKDMGSVRARAGWAWNCFLPYMFGGVSLGRADVLKSAMVSGTQVLIAPPNTVVPFSVSQTEGQSNRFIYGYAAGLGVDVMLAGGLSRPRRMGISQIRRPDRHQHQHRPRRCRLSVLTETQFEILLCGFCR